MYNNKSNRLLNQKQNLLADQPAPFPDSELHNSPPAQSIKPASNFVTLDQKLSTNSSPNDSEDSTEWEEFDMGCFKDNEMNDCATLFNLNKDKKSTGVYKSFEGNANKEEVTDLFLYKTHNGINRQKDKSDSTQEVFAILNRQIEKIEREKTHQVMNKSGSRKRSKKASVKAITSKLFCTKTAERRFTDV